MKLLLTAILLSILTACGGGEDLEPEEGERIPSGCAVMPRPPACI